MKKSNLTTMLMFAATLSLAQKTFTLFSKDIGGQAIKTEEFNGFGCTGKNQSPQLSWANAPEGTKSYAITVYGPDAPTGSGWWHWVVFDIPASATGLTQGAGDVSKKLLPPGAIQSITDFGQPGYGGPCPPQGDKPHQYVVTLYALKTDKLGLDAKASPALVGYSIYGNTLAKASIVAYYQR